MTTRERYRDECRQVQQNCTYTAEAHHWLAIGNRCLAYLFQMVPAAVAAITGVLVAAGKEPTSWLWATVVAATTSTIAGILDPNRNAQDHLTAARNFTVIKHDARFLHEAQGDTMGDEAFFVAVGNLHNQYGELCKVSPPTGAISFGLARKKVGAGYHEPDRLADGRIR